MHTAPPPEIGVVRLPSSPRLCFAVPDVAVLSLFPGRRGPVAPRCPTVSSLSVTPPCESPLEGGPRSGGPSPLLNCVMRRHVQDASGGGEEEAAPRVPVPSAPKVIAPPVPAAPRTAAQALLAQLSRDGEGGAKAEITVPKPAVPKKAFEVLAALSGTKTPLSPSQPPRPIAARPPVAVTPPTKPAAPYGALRVCCWVLLLLIVLLLLLML